jgi:predicted MFS family arabinose efflux permease
MRFLLANAIWGAALGMFNPFTNIFFSKYLGVPTTHLGNFFSVAQMIQAGALLVTPLLLRRISLPTGIMFTQLMTALSLVLLSTGHSLVWAELFYCAFMAAQHMSEPAIQSILMDHVSPEDRSGAAAMCYLVISIAQAAAAATGAYAFARFSYSQVLAGTGTAISVAAVLFRLLCNPEARQPAMATASSK